MHNYEISNTGYLASIAGEFWIKNRKELLDSKVYKLVCNYIDKYRVSNISLDFDVNNDWPPILEYAENFTAEIFANNKILLSFDSNSFYSFGEQKLIYLPRVKIDRLDFVHRPYVCANRDLDLWQFEILNQRSNDTEKELRLNISSKRSSNSWYNFRKATNIYGGITSGFENDIHLIHFPLLIKSIHSLFN